MTSGGVFDGGGGVTSSGGSGGGGGASGRGGAVRFNGAGAAAGAAFPEAGRAETTNNADSPPSLKRKPLRSGPTCRLLSLSGRLLRPAERKSSSCYQIAHRHT